MAPNLQDTLGSSPVARRTRSFSGRTTRSKSLAGGLDSALQSSPPARVTRFDLGPIRPSNVAFCKACKAPIVKSPVTPELRTYGRSDLEQLLRSSLLNAHFRAGNIAAAYSSTFQDVQNLRNKHGSAIGGYTYAHNPNKPKQPFITEDSFRDHPEWRYAKYTAGAHKILSTLSGELGRAMATSQSAVAALKKALEEEDVRIRTENTAEHQAKRKLSEDRWFEDQYAILKAEKPKRKKTRR